MFYGVSRLVTQRQTWRWRDEERQTALDMGREVDTRRKRESEKVQRERLGEGREMDNYGDTWI